MHKASQVLMSTPTPDTGASMAKTSNLAIYGGSGTSIMFGFTPGEWQIIGVAGGILLGLAGFIVNVYYKHKHYKLAEANAGKAAGLADD